MDLNLLTIWIHNTGNNSEKNEKSYKWQYKIVAYGDYNSSEKDYFINQASEDDDISEVQEGHEEQDKNETVQKESATSLSTTSTSSSPLTDLADSSSLAVDGDNLQCCGAGANGAEII